MAAFETVGTMIEDNIASYSSDISSALISNIAPIMMTGVTLYFLLKGWMFLTGRAEGAISDTVITAFKVALVSMVGLNAGNFVAWGLGFINGAESLLMSTLPGGSTTAWGALDTLWGQIAGVLKAFFKLLGDFGITTIGYALLTVLLTLLFLVAAAFLTLAALGILIVTKICLVIVSGFGPLFICMLMFPVTRTWFDGWLKSCMTYVFTMVMIAAVISLVSELFGQRLEAFENILDGVTNDTIKDGGAAEFLGGTFTFIIVCTALATLVKAVPSLASGIVGGIGMGAVGLGAMLRGAGSGATSAGVGVAAASQIARGNIQRGYEMMGSRLTGSYVAARTVGTAIGSTVSGVNFVSNSIRAKRAINAAQAALPQSN